MYIQRQNDKSELNKMLSHQKKRNKRLTRQQLAT